LLACYLSSLVISPLIYLSLCFYFLFQQIFTVGNSFVLFYCLCLVEFPVLVKLPIHICCSFCLSPHFICYCTHCLTCSILAHFADTQLCIYIPITNATLCCNALSLFIFILYLLFC